MQTAKTNRNHKVKIFLLRQENFCAAMTGRENVRELYHTLFRAVIWSHSPTIKPDDIQRSIVLIARKNESVLERHLGNGFDLQRLLDDFSRHYIVKAFEKSGQKKKKAAEMLGFSNYQTLGNWMDKLGLNSEESKE